MSRDASLTLEWGDGRHTFRLALGQLRELQENVNKSRARLGASLLGPVTLYKLLASGDAWPDEINEIVRLGLIGGGKTPIEAFRLVELYGFPARPLTESALHATAILAEALFGTNEETIEGKEETARAATEEMTSSPLSSSTGLELS